MGNMCGGGTMPMIGQGDRVPDATLRGVFPCELAGAGAPVSLREICGSGKVVLIGVPGVYFEPETQSTLPEFVRRQSEFRTLHVHEIAVIVVDSGPAVNAWARKILGSSPGQTMRFYADPAGAVTKALGLTVHGDGLADYLGPNRSRRYAMTVDQGAVQTMWTVGAVSDPFGEPIRAMQVLAELGTVAEDAE
eukprot:TRINITY_DN11048_c0_g1_i2.p1 TRINITY_DN11048_c0_g1~~TRINITY_DN11048_c0_g1_i2.p1  ORF type:complete len:192 (+),score=37.99 TRINITY_DN11048_c0_g1_i2:78-653(+)